jgi:hypothetical protein
MFMALALFEAGCDMAGEDSSRQACGQVATKSSRLFYF